MSACFCLTCGDAHQTDVLPRMTFKYCLAHDARPGATRNGFFHLWISKSRIYREREAIVATLARELPRAVPPGFTYLPPEIAFNVGIDFNYPDDLSQFPDMLLPHYVNLLSAVHPILMPIIDRFSTRLAPGERHAAVTGRGRIGVYDRERVREYTRSVQPFRNDKFLARFSHESPSCGADLRKTGYHIDHKIPFSKGGQSKEENLQPLCPACNLSKSNKDISHRDTLSGRATDRVLTCGRCRQRVRVPTGHAKISVTCPSCSGKFVADT